MICEDNQLRFKGTKTSFFQTYNLLTLKDKFEILSEEDEEIDIQEMQEVNLFSNGVNSSEDTRKKCYDNNFVIIEETLKEIIKAIKQLDKKIKE